MSATKEIASNAQQVSARWQPGQPITESTHIAAEKVLQRASGVDGLPQRMLDAMLAAAPAQPAAPPSGKTYEVLIHDLEVIASTTLHATVEGSRRSYERDAVRQAIGVIRASHGQAPAGATEPAEQQILEAAFAPAQPAVVVPLLDYAMQIAHERELRVTGNHHDEDGAKLRFEAAAMRHTATGAAQPDSVQEDAARYRWLAANCRSTSEHWGGRWSIVIEGPAPKSHNSEDDFDAAVDAARKQGATP